MTLAEERPDYPERVAAYLAAAGRRRLPWGAIVAGGGLTMTKSTGERAARVEVGEVAIAVFEALGVTGEMLERIAELVPYNATPEILRDALDHEVRATRALEAAIAVATAPAPGAGGTNGP